MRITANRQLDVFRNLHLHHGRLVVQQLLHGDDYLVDVFLVDLLPVLEPLRHVVDELLRHLLAQPHAVVALLHGHGVDVEPLRRRGLVAHLDGGEEVELPHDLLAFRKLQLGVLVVRVQLHALLEVLERRLGPEDGGLGEASPVVGLRVANRGLDALHTGWDARVAGRGRAGRTLTNLGFSSIALVASVIAYP